ncbi:cell division protein FtsL [Alkalicoccus halolimnae]|uniref:Cell division protein FtsL n=1 Tax=Alkalicoccus halolimnae TaxID=1667239 RepID=A0A5C7FRU5_9BACI|nr:cell division protein FtsL [Alkalicoccus halolimnae]TXF87435.1 cell division protein FtsL [Alkalicoccus halolimnae]
MSPLLDQRQTSAAPETKPNRQPLPGKIKRSITRGEKLIYGLAAPLILAFSFLIVSNYATLYSLNHDMQTIESNISEQESANEALALQVTELSDADRILTIAKTELGMSLKEGQVQVMHQID